MDDILAVTTDKLCKVYEQIGGRFIFLDCKVANDKVCAPIRLTAPFRFRISFLTEKAPTNKWSNFCKPKKTGPNEPFFSFVTHR